MIPSPWPGPDLEAVRTQPSHWEEEEREQDGLSSTLVFYPKTVFLSLQLTGIIQAMVDGQPRLQQVLEVG